MNIKVLDSKWVEISKKEITKGFNSLRISAECVADLFLGVDKELNRSLILSLPTNFQFHFIGIIKENLKIEFYPEQNLVVLQLCDNSFYDLFDDLIISLYQRIKDISNVDEYTKEFIYTFNKWSEFFENKIINLLNENIIKGLFGELLILKHLVNESSSYTINETLNSWKGPFDKGHDFELAAKNLEVKTKDSAQIDIKISSEYQLEKEFAKDLELVVVVVEKNNVNGMSIQDLVLDIKKTTIDLFGDTTIFFRAIGQKGITQKNIYLYNNIMFKPIHKITYDCNSNNFPKLTKTNIPKEINNLNYNLRISALDEFIISKIEF